MLTYRAIFKFLGDEVHAEVLDFPGVITSATTLEEARRLLCSALVEMAEIALLNGESLPQPTPTMTNDGADLEEPIHLLLEAKTHHNTAMPSFVSIGSGESDLDGADSEAWFRRS